MTRPALTFKGRTYLLRRYNVIYQDFLFIRFVETETFTVRIHDRLGLRDCLCPRPALTPQLMNPTAHLSKMGPDEHREKNPTLSRG